MCFHSHVLFWEWCFQGGFLVSEDGSEAVVGRGAKQSERQAVFRSVVRWFESAADVLAWRIKCQDEGVALSWVDEVAKSRAVLSALTRLGFLPVGAFSKLEGLVRVSDALAEAEGVLRVVSPVLGKCFEDFLPSEADISNAKSHEIRVAVGRGLLGCVARMVLDELVMRDVGAFMMTASRLPRTDALIKRAAKISSTDHLLGRAMAADAKADPELALASSLAALAEARAAVLSLRIDVRRNRIRVKRRRALARRKAK